MKGETNRILVIVEKWLHRAEMAYWPHNKKGEQRHNRLSPRLILGEGPGRLYPRLPIYIEIFLSKIFLFTCTRKKKQKMKQKINIFFFIKRQRAKFLKNVVSYILRKTKHTFNQKRSIKTGLLCLNEWSPILKISWASQSTRDNYSQ